MLVLRLSIASGDKLMHLSIITAKVSAPHVRLYQNHFLVSIERNLEGWVNAIEQEYMLPIHVFEKRLWVDCAVSFDPSYSFGNLFHSNNFPITYLVPIVE